MPGNREFFSKYRAPVFVETGTYLGDGIQAALDAGFQKVYSVELSQQFVEDARKRFSGDRRVGVIEGDSGLVLKEVIKTIQEPICYWLDGHWSSGKTAKGAKSSPLLDELEQIAEYPSTAQTILVDDMRCWSIDNREIGFGETEIINAILDINSRFRFRRDTGDPRYPNDVLVATLV